MNKIRNKKREKEVISEDEADISEDDNITEDEDSLDELVSEDDEDPEDGHVDESDDQEDNISEDEDDEDDAPGNVLEEGKKHREALDKLRQSDPTFYRFLEQNDQELLNFNASDSDEESDASEGSQDELHKPTGELEVDSDESDFEADDSGAEEGDGQSLIPVTLKMVEKWTQQLQQENSVAVIAEVAKAFHACIQRISGSEEDKLPCKFRVTGSAVFNAVVQLCVMEMQPAFRRFLKLPASMAHTQPSKSKKWTKVKATLKSYVSNLVKLLSRVSSEHIQTVTLKHLHAMAVLVAAFPTLCRTALKRLVSLWSEAGSQNVRILAFLCIARLACDRQNQQLEFVLKLMYVTYVRNTKFVSPNVLPGINFMRRSLVELFAIDEAAAYQNVFMYVRQLAIHLRNAVTTQKKETVQTVYNWQYVNSLHLWCELLGGSSEVSPLRSLIYPVVQVILGMVKLVPTAQYYPLRFHCARMLTSLSRRSRVFIPVLPLLLDVLTSFDFNLGHKRVSMKPLDLMCVLRASKLQQQENGFKDSVLEQLYATMLDYLSVEAHSVAFPDLVLPTVVQLRQFCKKVRVGNYCKKMRSLLDKVEENSRFIEKERAGATLKLADSRAVQAWENAVRSKGTPLATFHESWSKASQQKKAQQYTQNHKDDYDIPSIKRTAKRPQVKSSGPPELFPSDDDDSDDNLDHLGVLGDDSDTEEPAPKRTKRGKREVKPSQLTGEVLSFPDSGDIVEEFKLSEYE